MRRYACDLHPSGFEAAAVCVTIWCLDLSLPGQVMLLISLESQPFLDLSFNSAAEALSLFES